jgi:hypothetical protein
MSSIEKEGESMKEKHLGIVVGLVFLLAITDTGLGCTATLTPTIASGSAVVGDRIAFNATASGCGTAPVFRFSVSTVDGSQYSMRRDFAQLRYFEWSPMVEGAYNIKVEVKDAYTTADSDASLVEVTDYGVSANTSSSPCAISAAGGGTDAVAAPAIRGTLHPMVNILTVPSCSPGQRVSAEAFDVTSGTWRSVERRSCNATGKTVNFLIGGVRADDNNNICVRYTLDDTASAPVGATVGALPSSLRLPLTTQVPTGNEALTDPRYPLTFFSLNSRIYFSGLDIPEAATGGPCCDASNTCTGTSCCSDPSKGPNWQTVAQKQSNCWVDPYAVDSNNGKLLWYFSQTTLGQTNPTDPNAPWAFRFHISVRTHPATGAPSGIDTYSPSILSVGFNEEGRTRDVETPGPNLMRQFDIAGTPLWETNIYALGSRLPPGFNLTDVHHDHIVMPNGDIALLGHVTKCMPHTGPGVAVNGTTHPCPPDAFGSPQQKYIGDAIIVVDRTTGAIRWTWNLFDHDGPGEIDHTRRPRVPGTNGVFDSYIYCAAPTDPACAKLTGRSTGDPLLCTALSPGECPVMYAEDWTHSNGISIDRNGDFLLSVRFQAWVVKINAHAPTYDGDGSITWKLGQCKDNPSDPDDPICFTTARPDGEPTQLQADAWESHEHNPTVLQDGTIMLWDNRNGKCRTDFFDPVARACMNGWTDCVASYTAFSAGTCPFASRAQRWKLNTQRMTAEPLLNFPIPQLDTDTSHGTPSTSAFGALIGGLQRLAHNRWLADAGALAYTGGNTAFTSQVHEFGCADGSQANNCTLVPINIWKTNHQVYRAFRMKRMNFGVTGIQVGFGGGNDDQGDDDAGGK